MKKIFTGFVIMSFFIYIYISLYVLFMRLGGVNRLSQNSLSFNFIPLKTIIEYIKVLVKGSGHALMNLGGNLLIFFPLGFYLPFFIKKMCSIKFYIIFVVALIIIIEVMQVITGTGSFDIDDFILNFIGALMGLFVCKHTLIFLLRLRSY